MKKSISKLITLLLLLSIFYACNMTQSRIDSVKSKIENAEENFEKLSSDEWKSLDSSIKNLRDDFKKNKDDYSDEQRKEIAEIKGRYTALQIKKGTKDFINSVIDFGTEIENIYNGLGK